MNRIITNPTTCDECGELRDAFSECSSCGYRPDWFDRNLTEKPDEEAV